MSQEPTGTSVHVVLLFLYGGAICTLSVIMLSVAAAGVLFGLMGDNPPDGWVFLALVLAVFGAGVSIFVGALRMHLASGRENRNRAAVLGGILVVLTSWVGLIPIGYWHPETLFLPISGLVALYLLLNSRRARDRPQAA